VLAFGAVASALALDLDPLWDFDHPELSEDRFAFALKSAGGDDALILETQIARTHGLRRDFAAARSILAAIEPRVTAAGAEARCRYWLELGRTYASATHPPEAQTADTRSRARAAFTTAADIAQTAHLDALAVDALHMLAFVDTAPADQLQWGRQALAVATASTQPAARKWEASLRNNIGYALHGLGRYDEALAEFRLALALRERGSDAEATRAAQWMVAWTMRAQGRLDEAMALQLRLERECAAAGAPDPDVFQELELLYRAKGDAAQAQRYAQLRNDLAGAK
jgi:tetratricopeptide (TPR) repeat protein